MVIFSACLLLTYCIDNHTVVNLAILLLQEIATRKKKTTKNKKKNWNGERERTLGLKILNNKWLIKMLNLRWEIEEEIFRPQVVSHQFRKLHTPSCLSPAKKPTPQTKQNKTKQNWKCFLVTRGTSQVHHLRKKVSDWFWKPNLLCGFAMWVFYSSLLTKMQKVFILTKEFCFKSWGEYPKLKINCFCCYRRTCSKGFTKPSAECGRKLIFQRESRGSEKSTYHFASQLWVGDGQRKILDFSSSVCLSFSSKNQSPCFF